MCFAIYKETIFPHYTERIQNLRQAKIRGEIIVAKPVLLLALMDGIEAGVFCDNRFTLNEWLEEHYLALLHQFSRHSQFDKPTDINNPFWHLATDGFWHLQLKNEAGRGETPSKAWLKDNVVCARFDDDLWVLLQSQEWCNRLRDFIVCHKLGGNNLKKV